MEDIKKAYCEVDAILEHMEDIYVTKIPSELRQLFKEQKNDEYIPQIDWNIPLNEQNLMRKTIAILAMLNLDYWCEDEEERQQLRQLYKNNDKVLEDSVEKYGVESLFKQPEIKEDKVSDTRTELVEVKQESFIKKILRKISTWFKK